MQQNHTELKKSVILVNPYFQHQKNRNIKDTSRRKTARQYPPVNLLQLGGVLKTNGFKVHILDVFIEKNAYSFIDRICSTEDVALIGFTVKMAPVITVAQQLSYYIKRHYPQVKIVWGGLLPTMLPETTLRETYADYIVTGQGEQSLLKLTQAITNNASTLDIPGLCYLNDKAYPEMVQIPQVSEWEDYNADWSLIDSKLNKNQQPYYAGTTTTRGCPLKCSFCYLTALEKSQSHLSKWHEKPLEMILKDVDTLLSKGMNVFTFQDDCFLMNKNRILPLIHELKKRQIYIEQCVTSIRTIIPDVIEEIAPIIQQISYSIETVNPDLQKILNKGIPADLIIETNKLLFSHNINSVHNFIFGIPGETDDDLKANIDIAIKLRRINPFVRFTGMFCIPYPKSAMEKWLVHEKNLRVPWDLRMLTTTDMSDLRINPAFQPWINNPDECQFYNDFMIIFDAVFSRWQHKSNPYVEHLLKQDRLHRLFENALLLEKPPENHPYILDNLLSNPEILYPHGKLNLAA